MLSAFRMSCDLKVGETLFFEILFFKRLNMTMSFPGLSSFVSLKVCLLGFPLQEHNDLVTKCYWSVLFWKPLPGRDEALPGRVAKDSAKSGLL